MIHVYIRGRLGNQLFQYAFVRMLQHHNPEVEVCWHWNDVLSQGKPEDGWINSLSQFRTVDTKNTEKHPNLTLRQKVVMNVYWRFFPHNGTILDKNKYQMRWAGVMAKFGLYYLDLGYYPFPKDLNDAGDLLISGNFESPQYFNDIDEQLREEIIPCNPLLVHNESLMHTILTTNSVCISVRRGDFIDNSKFCQLLNICGKSYYDNAVAYIEKHVNNPTLIFFSDDIEWVRNNLKYNLPCYYECGTDPQWEKMRLMCSCRHFIIANSTFSWWAQHLCRFTEKIVVAPSRWYNSDFVPDLYEDNWVKIPV